VESGQKISTHLSYILTNSDVGRVEDVENTSSRIVGGRIGRRPNGELDHRQGTTVLPIGRIHPLLTGTNKIEAGGTSSGGISQTTRESTNAKGAPELDQTDTTLGKHRIKGRRRSEVVVIADDSELWDAFISHSEGVNLPLRHKKDINPVDGADVKRRQKGDHVRRHCRGLERKGSIGVSATRKGDSAVLIHTLEHESARKAAEH